MIDMCFGELANLINDQISQKHSMVFACLLFDSFHKELDICLVQLLPEYGTPHYSTE